MITPSAIGSLGAIALGTVLALSAALPALAAGGITHDATLSGNGLSATVTVQAGADAAGDRMSVLIMNDDADLGAPKKSEIAYLNEVVLDAAGAAVFTFAIPRPDLDDYAIAMNAGSGRYLESLDPNGTLPAPPVTPGNPQPAAPGGSKPAGGGSGGTGQPADASAPTATPGSTPTSTPTHNPATDSTAPPSAAGPEAQSTGGSAVPWVVAAAVLVAAVAAFGIWLLRRRSSGTS